MALKTLALFLFLTCVAAAAPLPRVAAQGGRFCLKSNGKPFAVRGVNWVRLARSTDKWPANVSFDRNYFPAHREEIRESLRQMAHFGFNEGCLAHGFNEIHHLGGRVRSQLPACRVDRWLGLRAMPLRTSLLFYIQDGVLLNPLTLASRFPGTVATRAWAEVATDLSHLNVVRDETVQRQLEAARSMAEDLFLHVQQQLPHLPAAMRNQWAVF